MAHTTEHQEQCALCRYLDLHNVPHCSIPNGVKFGTRNPAATMARLKKEGLQPGAPDLLIFRLATVRLSSETAARAPIAIEMKPIKGGRLSPSQKELHPVMRREGWVVIVAKGHKDAITQLAEYGIVPPLREG